MLSKKLVATFAIFSTLCVATSYAKSDKQSKSYNTSNIKFKMIAVRATKYHASEKGADKDTKKGNSSTGVKLREGKPGVIGTVATDPKIIPTGSLVLVPSKNGEVIPYLSVDRGGAVTRRAASLALAKAEGRGKNWSNRPVVDIYSARAITDDWTTVLVIESDNLGHLKGKELTARLQERMSINYWPYKYAALGLTAISNPKWLIASR